MRKMQTDSRRSLVAILLAAFVLFQFAVSFSGAFLPLPGNLSCADTEISHSAENAATVSVLSRRVDLSGRLSALSKAFILFFNFAQILQRKFETLFNVADRSNGNFLTPLYSVVLRL